MKTTLLPVTLLTLALSLLPSRAPACGGYGTPTFTAHEWGTFTSVQGADGVQLEWNPLVASDLPPFVHNVNRTALDPRARSYPLYLAKTAVRSLQRMETPVIYFYSDRERTVDVTVQFPQGHITEWYPQLNAESFKTPGRITKLVWDRVTVLPRSQHPNLEAELPTHNAPSHYFPAREAEADYLRREPAKDAKPELESLLFYRGVGYFSAPLAVSMPGGEKTLQLKNNGAEPLGNLFVLQVTGDRANFRFVESLAPGAEQVVTLPCSRSAQPLAEVSERLATEMRRALVREGLFDREAAAMVKTWRDSWFADSGVRVLYTLPRAWTDRTLPLAITPTPQKTVHVMVGRAEVITPAIENAVLAQLQRFISAEPAARAQIAADTRALGLGRFLEPTVRRLAERVPAQQFSTLGWEFMTRVTAPTPAATAVATRFE
ncbi:MAG: hypothetical protein ACKODH_04585 [Limisphaerales bacterium]